MIFETIAPTLGPFYVGPLVLGLIIGFVAGILMNKNSTNIVLTKTAWIVILIFVVIMAYLIGNFPYYGGLPLAPGFIASIIGALIGRTILGTKIKTA
ncbi:MAG: energy-converting hydrogenase B subunit J [Methanobacteriaceae archaeon]|nr:energy-converting hydrogenase B subunit J [Methanobacteriaceae archaeon]